MKKLLPVLILMGLIATLSALYAQEEGSNYEGGDDSSYQGGDSEVAPMPSALEDDELPVAPDESESDDE